jgi:hypothetical protein
MTGEENNRILLKSHEKKVKIKIWKGILFVRVGLIKEMSRNKEDKDLRLNGEAAIKRISGDVVDIVENRRENPHTILKLEMWNENEFTVHDQPQMHKPRFHSISEVPRGRSVCRNDPAKS